MKSSINRKIFTLLTSFIIWGAMTAIWGWVWYNDYAHIIELPFFRRGNWMIIAVYGILLSIVTQFYGGYRVGYYRRGDLIFSSILSMLVTNGITYMQTSLVGRKFMNPWPIVWMSIADFFLLWIWATWSHKLYIKVHDPRQLLVIYGGSSLTRDLVGKIAEREDRYVIREAISVDAGIEKVKNHIDKFNAVLLCDVKSGNRNHLLKYCYSKGVRVYMTPKISDVLIRGSENIHLFDSPLLLSRNDGLNFEQRFVKRLMDIILSLIASVLAAPFMLIIALCIKIGDGGPVFYKQTRLTIDGKAFELYKFRSMIINAEAETGAQLANENDSRITKVGKIIRKIRFDELPQLINIIKGDMSLVGPRPERPEIAEQYMKTMKEFDFRLKVKAGLTGYAQILGKYNTTPYDKLKLDLMYITGYSVLLDIKLILQTIKTLFMKQSTEGIEEGKTTAEK